MTNVYFESEKTISSLTSEDLTKMDVEEMIRIIEVTFNNHEDLKEEVKTSKFIRTLNEEELRIELGEYIAGMF